MCDFPAEVEACSSVSRCHVCELVDKQAASQPLLKSHVCECRAPFRAQIDRSTGQENFCAQNGLHLTSREVRFLPLTFSVLAGSVRVVVAAENELFVFDTDDQNKTKKPQQSFVRYSSIFLLFLHSHLDDFICFSSAVSSRQTNRCNRILCRR